MTRRVGVALALLTVALTGCAGQAADRTADVAAVSPAPRPTVTVTATPTPEPTVTMTATATASPEAEEPASEVSLTQCGSQDDAYPSATVNFVNNSLDYHAYSATVEFRSIYGGPVLGRAAVETAPVPPGASDHRQAIDYNPAAQDAIPANTVKCRIVHKTER